MINHFILNSMIMSCYFNAFFKVFKQIKNTCILKVNLKVSSFRKFISVFSKIFFGNWPFPKIALIIGGGSFKNWDVELRSRKIILLLKIVQSCLHWEMFETCFTQMNLRRVFNGRFSFTFLVSLFSWKLTNCLLIIK